jgi:hypothetical protein
VAHAVGAVILIGTTYIQRGLRMPDVTSLPRWKRILFGAILTLMPAVVLIGALELGGRLYIHARYGVSGKSYGLWKYDRELGAIHAENAYNLQAETNNLGFRNKEDVPARRKDGSLLVIAYGGSTTFCPNLRNSESWPALLEGLLRSQAGRDAQVLNGGHIIWSLSHLYTRAKRELGVLKPDYVILYTGLNEEWNAAMLAEKDIDLAARLKAGDCCLAADTFDQSRWLKRNSVIIRYLDSWGPGVLGPLVGPRIARQGPDIVASERSDPDPIVFEHYLRTLSAMLELIQKNGAKAIFVMDADASELRHVQRMARYSRAAADHARQKGALVIDGQEVVSSFKGDKKTLFVDTGVHFTVTGARLLANLIYDRAFAATAARAR